MSKHATAGTSGASRGDSVERGERLRLVQGCEVDELAQLGDDGSSTSAGTGEPCAPVNDPVPDGIERSNAPIASASDGRIRLARRAEIRDATTVVAVIDDSQLQTRSTPR